MSVNDQPEPNLDVTIDLRFAGIEAELYVVLQHLETVERQLPQAQKSECQRLEQDLYGIDDEAEYNGVRDWIEEFVEEVLPRLYRSPIIVELWAVYESGIVEIAKYLQNEQEHSLSVDDLRSNNDFERAQKYYEHILTFPLIVIDDIKDRLNILLQIRNAVAHCNGRVEVMKDDRLRKIRAWETKHGEISTEGTYLTFTSTFLEKMAAAVKTSLEDLINRVKEKY